MNEQTYQSMNTNFKNQLSFTQNKINHHPQQHHNPPIYGQNIQHINDCESFSQINQQYLQLKNKVQGRIKLLEMKCYSESNIGSSCKNKSHLFDNNIKPSNQRQQQYPQTQNDRERTHSFVDTTNPSNINNLINNLPSQNFIPQIKNQYITSGQKQNYQKIDNFPPNLSPPIPQLHQHLHPNFYQNRYQHPPCVNCSNQRMFYFQPGPLNGEKMNTSYSAYTNPHTNSNHTQQADVHHLQQIPCYGANFPQQTFIKGLNYPLYPSQLAQSINVSNNGTSNTVNTSNINDVMLQNIREQKQINMNLKALSQKLSDFSGNQRDQNVFYKENRHLNSKKQNRQKFIKRENEDQNEDSENPSQKHRERAYYSTNSPHNPHLRSKSKKVQIPLKDQLEHVDKYHRSPYIYQDEGIQNVYYQSNKKIKRNRQGNQGSIKRKNSKRQLNQVFSLNQNLQKKLKFNEKIIYPTYRYDIQKNSSKNSNSMQGRAKSASLHTISTNERDKKLYTFKGVKQPENQTKKHIKRKNGDYIHRQKKRYLDPDYFAQKQSDFSSKHLTHHNCRHPNYDNNYEYFKNGCHYGYHPNQSINYLNHPYYPRHHHNHHNQHNHQNPHNPNHSPHHYHHNAHNYHRYMPNNHHQYENSQINQRISPEDQVNQMYQNRKQNKNKQRHKNSQHRSKRHQKEYILQSFSQQQKLRKQLIQKITKNFPNKYDIN